MNEALFMEIAKRAWYYQEGILSRSVVPSAAAMDKLQELKDKPLPENPTSATEVLDMLDRYGSPATIASTGGRYFGLVVGSTLPAALAANWLVTTWDQNAAARIMAPGTVAIETVAARWILELLSLPAQSGVGFVTGSTMAHFVCLAAARNALLTKMGWDVENDGLFGAPSFRVVVSQDVHISVIKVLGMLGLGRNRIERVPVDAEGRMLTSQLPALDDKTVVCIQAGNVHTGNFDPATEICARAQDAGAWVHVDGAFGLWAAASPRYAHLVAGVAKADSWGVDAHKWLNVPYDCGIAICRDPIPMQSALAVRSEYLVFDPQGEPEDFTPEMSRRARGIDVWAAIQSLGRKGMANLIELSCEHAQTFKTRLTQAGFEVLNEVVINQVLVAFGTDEHTKHVVNTLQQDGTTWCGDTIWQGRVVMRISISSWCTSSEDVNRSIDAIIKIATATK
ncbi:pyridoxal-dependent decarboxylase [Achromatium sp. WMS1]|nr:pyridoxal-dependent decarboxylase [Achromatium sp. WMS1]